LSIASSMLTQELVQETPFRVSWQAWVATSFWWGSTICRSWRYSQT